MLEKMFKLKENNTNVRTEVVGGLTTFMTMAYILAVNPAILSASGMDATAILMATALAAFVGTVCMALLANYPFALAPGLGLNAYFAYTVCGAMGYSWQFALFAVFVEGLVFVILSVTNVREAIFNAIPLTLKKGVSVGIGLFVAFIGLQNGSVVVNSDATLVTIVNFREDFTNVGICALLALIGVIIISILYVKKVNGITADFDVDQAEHGIIYIDEIHNLCGAGATGEGSFDASNMLKSYLADGKIRFIGATTFEEYKKHFEKNKRLVRRFQNIEIKEPSEDETIAILNGLKNRYEKYNSVNHWHVRHAVSQCANLL